MQMTRRVMLLILSALSAVCVVCAAVLMFGITAYAEEENHTGHSGWMSFSSSSGTNLTNGNYYLSENISLSSAIVINGDVTLCLNGYMLTAPSGNSAITVTSGTLTLCSCSSRIYYYNEYSSGLYAWSTSYSSTTASNSYISYGLITSSGNTASASNGGGIYVSGDATLKMYDIDISGNVAGQNGGGVYVAAGGIFEMYSGSIFGNLASGNGGGVYVYGTTSNPGLFTMTGGSIYGNNATGDYEDEDVNVSAGYGGGIYSNGTVTISGGSIEENTALRYGGGMYVNYGSVEISGNDFVLYGNSASNVSGICLSDRTSITVTINGGFILDTISAGNNTAASINIQGGYYPSSAVSSNTIYGVAIDTSNYILLTASQLSQDEDLQNSDYRSSVAYGVYEFGTSEFYVSYPNGSIVYDGSAIEYGTDFVITSNISSSELDELLTITYSAEPINAGTYTLTVAMKQAFVDYVNKIYYQQTSGNVTLEIAQAPAPADNTQDVVHVYDGNAYGLEFALSGFVNGESLEALLSSGYASIMYSLTGETDWTTDSLMVTNVADSPLTVYYRITFTNYETVTGSHTITITKASVPEGAFPEIPSVSAECGTVLLAANLPTGWVWADGNSIIYWGADGEYIAYYYLDANASNYDWTTAAENAGMTYNEEENRLEYSVAITVTHTTLEYVEANDPTCLEPGNNAYWYCEICGNHFSDEGGTILYEDWEISALGHDYDDDNLTIVSPTENSVGSLIATCIRCDNHASIELPVLSEESYEVETDPATCTEDGTVYWYYINEEEGIIEGMLVATTTIPATGHTLVHVDAIDATYEEGGNIEYWYCEVCGSYFSDEAATNEISADSVTTAKLTHTTEIVLLCLGGAVCVALAVILAWLIIKKRREE